MCGEIGEVIAAVDGIVSLEAQADLSRLQELIDQYFAAPEAAEHPEVWFRLYERFPENYACGIFWSILHGLEALPGCGPLVV